MSGTGTPNPGETSTEVDTGVEVVVTEDVVTMVTEITDKMVTGEADMTIETTEVMATAEVDITIATEDLIMDTGIIVTVIVIIEYDQIFTVIL